MQTDSTPWRVKLTISSLTSLIVLELLGVEYGPKLVISYDGINDQLFSMRHGVEPDYRNVLHRYDEQVVTLQALLPSWAFQSYFVSVAISLLDQRGGPFGGRGTVFGQVLDAGVLTLPRDDRLSGVSLFLRNLRSMRAVSAAHHAQFVAATAHWKTPNPDSSRQNELLRQFFAREQWRFWTWTFCCHTTTPVFTTMTCIGRPRATTWWPKRGCSASWQTTPSDSNRSPAPRAEPCYTR